METQISSLEQLTLLQQELGYKQGDISTVALLGLIGEAGEVLNETDASEIKNNNKNSGIDIYTEALVVTGKVDELKKEVRKGMSTFEISLPRSQEPEFDAELSDCFYYFNILAMNRGLTIEDLAKMAHDKVRAKQAAGGSSEDRKTT